MPAPGKAGVPPGRHSVGSARRRRLNRQSSAACLANIRRARNHPVQHKPARAREQRVEKSNGMTPVVSEKRCISQPVARQPDPDGPPWPQEPPQLTNCLRNKRPDARMGHRTAQPMQKPCVLASRSERLGVVSQIRTTPLRTTSQRTSTPRPRCPGSSPCGSAESLTPLASAHPASAALYAVSKSTAAMVECCAAQSFIVFQAACHGPSYQQFAREPLLPTISWWFFLC